MLKVRCYNCKNVFVPKMKKYVSTETGEQFRIYDPRGDWVIKCPHCQLSYHHYVPKPESPYPEDRTKKGWHGIGPLEIVEDETEQAVSPKPDSVPGTAVNGQVDE